MGYQILAVAITYLIIGLSLILSELFSSETAGGDLVHTVLLIIVCSFIGPVVAATHSLMGGIITLIGLYQAWKLNASAQVNITGPHAIAPVVASTVTPIVSPEPLSPPVLPPTAPPPPLSV